MRAGCRLAIATVMERLLEGTAMRMTSQPTRVGVNATARPPTWYRCRYLFTSLAVVWILAEAWHYLTPPASIRDFELPDGRYQIVEVRPDSTFHVRGPVNGIGVNPKGVNTNGVGANGTGSSGTYSSGTDSNRAGSTPTNDFEFRLAGLRIPREHVASACQFARDFIGTHAVELHFDRQRYTRGNQAIGYLVVGDRMLNVELVERGLAEPSPVIGNSSSTQTRIAKAARQGHSVGNAKR